MPVFSSIATAVGGFFAAASATAVGSFLLNATASLALAAGARKIAKNRAGSPSFSVRTRMSRGADVPQSFIVGKTATAGTLAYVNTGGGGHSPNATLRWVVSLSDLPITAVSAVWVNGVRRTLAAPEPTGKQEISGFGGFHQIQFYDGTQTVAEEELYNNFSGHSTRPYEDTAIGTGTAYAMVYAYIEKDLFRNGIPQLLFEVEGIPRYDISKDTTAGGSGAHRWDNPATWESSENPAVIIYNLLRGIQYGGEWYYGLQGVTAAQLPAAHWIAEIQACDALVDATGSTQEPRYRASGEIPVNAQAHEVIRGFLDACNGRLSDAGGVYKLFVGQARTAVATFNDDDILSTREQSFTPFYGLADSINGISATYPSPDAGWQPDPASPLFNADYETEDGARRLLADVAFDFVPYSEQVQRLMKAALAEARRAQRHTITLGPKYWALEPGDVIEWTSARNGYVTKQFRVDGVIDTDAADVILDLTEIDPTDYDFDTDTDFTTPSQPGILAEVIDSQAVPGFTVSATTIKDASDTDRRPAILAEWDEVDDDVRAVKFQTRVKATGAALPEARTGTPEDESAIISDGILPGVTYEVRARLVVRPARPLEWSDWEEVTASDIRIGSGDLGDDLTTAGVPGVPSLSTSLVADGLAKVVATFTAGTNAVSYEMGVLETGGNELFVPIGGTRYEFETLPGIEYTIRVRSVSATGDKSAWTATDTITAATDGTAPADPTGMTATAGFGVMWLTWDANTEADLSHYEVVQKTNSSTPGAGPAVHDFTTAATAATISGLANSTQYWYWVRAVDTSGNRSDWSMPDDATTTGTPAANVTTASLIGLVDATSFASSLSAVDIVGSLPSSGNYEGRVAFLTTDNKLYRYDGSAWINDVDGADLVTDSITTGAVAAGAIKTAQLDAGAATLEKLAVGDFTNFAAGSFGNWDNHNWDLATGATLSTAQSKSPGQSLCLDDTHTTSTKLRTTIDCDEGDEFHLIFWVRPNASVTGRTGAGSRLRLIWFDETDTAISFDGVAWDAAPLTTWTQLSGTFTAPAGAVRLELRALSDHTAGIVYLDNIAFRRVVDGVFIADGGITAAKLSAGEVITLSAQIADAIITDAKIFDLSAAKLTAGTALAGTITVSGTALSTVESRADDPAARINSASTQVDPGKIVISGVTSLADWRGTLDQTTIDGGAVEADTITVAKTNTADFTASGLSLFGGALQSTDFSTGVSGWEIQKTGNAEFNQLIVRESVVAGAVYDGGEYAAAAEDGANWRNDESNIETANFDVTTAAMFNVAVTFEARGVEGKNVSDVSFFSSYMELTLEVRDRRDSVWQAWEELGTTITTPISFSAFTPWLYYTWGENYVTPGDKFQLRIVHKIQQSGQNEVSTNRAARDFIRGLGIAAKAVV